MKVKIFNLGLPRTGTTSFHEFMKANDLKSCHTNDGFIHKCFPKDFFDFIEGKYKNNSIYKYIEDYDVFSDLPWYSRFLRNSLLNLKLPDTKIFFVATIRDVNSWVESIKTIKVPIQREKTELFHTLEFGDVFLKNTFNNEQLKHIYLNFYNDLPDTVIRLPLDDSDHIIELINKIVIIKNKNYPHYNKNRKENKII